jgi:DNA-binding response OmpR family regulator
VAEHAHPILVVDDELPLLAAMEWVLADEGWHVETATTGEEALDRAAEREPALVVLDMALPLINGEGVASRLRTMYGDVPIIVVTADGRAEAKARRVGARTYLQKPFNLDDLIDSVRSNLYA